MRIGDTNAQQHMHTFIMVGHYVVGWLLAAGG
jgi:hypothetical protein